MTFASLRRPLLALATLTFVFTLGACSKKDDPVAGLSQDEADELIQIAASMAAADSGGWMTEILATYDATPRFFSSGAAWRVAAGDTTFPRGHTNWSLNMTYYSPDLEPSEIFTDSTEYIEYLSLGSGRIPIVPFGPSSGFAHYGHASDTVFVDGVGSDTLTFKGHAAVDSAMIQVNSSSGSKFYYVDNVLDYDVTFLPGSLFPTEGFAEITAFVEVLNSFNRNDRDGYFDVAITITFDGTQTPIAAITLSADAVTTVYQYRLDLRSGALARI